MDTEMHEYAYAYHTPAPLDKITKCAGINIYPRNGYARSQPRNLLTSHIIASGSSSGRDTYDNMRLNQHPIEWDADDHHHHHQNHQQQLQQLQHHQHHQHHQHQQQHQQQHDRINESGSSLYAEANVFHPRPVTVQPYDYRD